MESRIILETTKIGGSAQANDLKNWKNGLIQDSSTWAIIDRDYSGTVAVWDIICRPEM